MNENPENSSLRKKDEIENIQKSVASDINPFTEGVSTLAKKQKKKNIGLFDLFHRVESIGDIFNKDTLLKVCFNKQGPCKASKKTFISSTKPH